MTNQYDYQKRRIKRLWVYPEFKKAVKLKAAEKEISIREYTKQLATKLDDLDIKKPCKKRGGRGFDFKI